MAADESESALGACPTAAPLLHAEGALREPVSPDEAISPQALASSSPVAIGLTRQHALPTTKALAGAALFYALAALVATWPLVGSLTRGLAGDPRGDTWKHAWGYWWFGDAARQGGIFPTHTTLLGFPDGGSLYNIDPLNSLLSVPLQACFPLPLAFNLLILFNLVAGATAAWALARHVSGDGWPALVAGIVYAFCPFVLSYSVASGVGETTNLVWMPLFLLALLTVTEGPERETGWTNAAVAGLLLGMTAFSCWYYGIFAFIWAGLGLLCYVFALLRRSGGEERGQRLRQIALRSFVLLVVCIDVVTPALVAFWMTLQNPDSMHPHYISERSAGTASVYLDKHNSTTLQDFVQLGKGNAVISHVVDRLERSAYVGGAVMILVVLALAYDRRSRFWACSAMLFGVLSLGPRVMLSRESVTATTNLLYEAFYRGIPGFTQVAIPFRLCVPLMLACGVLACLGLGAVLVRTSPVRRRCLAVGAAVIVLSEFLLASPAPFPLPVLYPQGSDLCAKIRAMSDVRAVLDLPADWIEGDDYLLPGSYFYNQSAHHKPIPYKVSGRMSPIVERNALVASVRALNLGMALEHEPTKDELRRAADRLHSKGIDAVVLHRQYLREKDREKVEAMLKLALGDPVGSDGEDLLFRVGSETP